LILRDVANDIVWASNSSISNAMDAADDFWIRNRDRPRIAKAVCGVIHCMFMAHDNTALMFEEFIYLYTGLDGCPLCPPADHGRRGRVREA
jgi:hypothetical protein